MLQVFSANSHFILKCRCTQKENINEVPEITKIIRVETN